VNRSFLEKLDSKLEQRKLVLVASCLLHAACTGSPEGYLENLDSIAQAHSNWCDPPNPPDTYDFYPGTGSYPLGSAATYPWPGEDFENYTDGQTVECSSSRSSQSHLEVTSGCLVSKYVGTRRRGFTTASNFRVLAVGLNEGQRVKWQDQTNDARLNVLSWTSPGGGAASFQGVHLFARYRTENDLYVASLRKNGEVLIQKKLCGTYTALSRDVLRDANGTPRGEMTTGTWYRLRFSAIGNRLALSVDNVPQIQVTDGSFSWGTSGIRTDFADVYIDDWTVR
jgi:hypothetical protein